MYCVGLKSCSYGLSPMVFTKYLFSDVSRSQSPPPYFFSGTCTISTLESPELWLLLVKKNFKPSISDASNDILLKTNDALDSMVTAFTNIGNMIIFVMNSPSITGYKNLRYFFFLPKLYFFRPVREKKRKIKNRMYSLTLCPTYSSFSRFGI